MKIAVIQFPGSNCDQDCFRALRDGLGVDAGYLWHKETSLAGFDAVVIPGGFSYGDYLRCGAIARFAPVMREVGRAAKAGMPIIGICNGFQILCEAGLLPGALIRNRSLEFVCQSALLRVETKDTLFTAHLELGRILRMPIAHGEGAYFAIPELIKQLEANDQIVFRYVNALGKAEESSNPNGSVSNIAGICSPERNVLGLMPHPDRAWDHQLGSADGLLIFRAMAQAVLAA
jgi:phosphoribosylformylglycinamidine synthase I